ncbi:MAG: hypothetical protein HYZ57_21165 [Acidobacteria bacterium]|nr:hypothetical protein [Acidobacteriota bacterium]MBI3282337.1 hypothetical protein [Acidobacteriota bacterium]
MKLLAEEVSGPVTFGDLTQFTYLQILDILTTIAFLVQGVQEANPVVKFMIAAAPSPLVGLVALKILAVAMAGACWYFGKRAVLIAANLSFALIVAWNLVAITVAAAARP